MSSTTNIGLFKHDNPATNTDEFNVDKALNENWDKLDTAIGKDRERITTLENDNTTNKTDILNIKEKNTEQDKYISELEAENTRLKEDLNGLPKGQVSGETIDLSDSAEMRCELKISGNSKQETREGYNIAKINTDNFELTSNTIKNKSTTVGGNILTHIKLKAGQTITSNLLLLSKPSKDTSFSVRIGSSDVANLSFSKFDELNLNTKQSKIYTATEDVEFDVKIWGNANKDIFEFQYWVTIGTEEKDYEQYGASPSPDYPSEVKCCGDNFNLYNKSTNARKGYLSGTVGAEIVKVDSTTRLLTDEEITVKPNTIYTFTLGTTKTLRYNIFEIDENNIILNVIAITNNSDKTFTTNANTKKLSVMILWQTTTKEITLNDIADCNIKLEKGSIATLYSPYGQGSINEAICNKNLAVIESGGISTSTGLEIVASNYYKSKFIQVLNNKTFTGSYNTNASSKQVVMFEYDKDKNFLRFTNTNSSSHTATVGDDTKYIRYRFLTEPNIKPTQVQIEEGSIATPYQEHKEQTYTIPTQQPFRSVGNTRDTFIKKNNKWYERHYIARKIFDGTEDWKLRDSSSNTTDNSIVLFSLANPFDYKLDNSNEYALSNSFNIINKIDNIVNMYTKSEAMAFYYNNTNLTRSLYINIKSQNTVDSLKAYLAEQYNAGTPVYVDYILETPLDIECTEEQNTILDKIEKEAKTYKNVTHMYSTDNISSYKDVTYKKDIDTMITNIEQAILSQGGNI